MAEKIKIDIDVNSKSISELVNDMKSLSKEIETATDPKRITELDREIDKTSQSIKEITKNVQAFDLKQVMDDTATGAESLTNSIGKMEDELRRLYHTGQENTEEFKNLQQATADMKSDVANLDREINLLGANDSLQQFSGGLSNVGTSLKNLDFKTAATDAALLVDMSNKMSFKTATEGIKNLGKTFINLGKALLANPLFLLAAAITAIAVVIYKLMDELGLLDIMLKAVGEVIDWLMIPIDAMIQGLKNLTDWLGWTSHAAEEAADKEAEAFKRAADVAEKNSNTMVQALDNEMAKMKARGIVTDEEFAKMQKIEARKLELLADTAKARLDEAEAAVKAAIIKGDLDDDEIKALKDKRDEAVLAYDNANAQIEINDIRAKKAAADRIDAQVKKEEEANAKTVADEKAALAERQSAWKAYQANRLSAEREIDNLMRELSDLQAKDADEQLELDVSRMEEEYARKIEDTLANEDLLESEKEALIQYYEDIRAEKERELREARADEIQAAEDKAEEKRLAKEAKLEEDRQKALQKEKEDAAERTRIKEEETKAAEDMEARKKQAALDTTRAVLSAVIAAAGEASAIGKAAAVAQVTIDTIQGAMSAFNSMAGIPIVGPALGGVAAAAVGVMGAMNVKKILSTKTPGGGGSGGAGSSTPAIAQAPDRPRETPNVDLYGSPNETGVNSSDSDSVERGGNNNNGTVRAVVSWSDIDAVSNNNSNLQNEMQL